ncbi:EAP30/Vps36 family protein [Perilla frutescens var. frutescens]|nr:EAP30/Vps36 family protein [Perilla frutescens var. frutescens]
MINLIDVYCLFNRARGTELISPDDLLQACSLWEKFDVPVMLRKFDSGVVVIQSKTHSDEEVFARIASLIMKPDALLNGISAGDAARTLGVAPAVAKEYLLAAEGKGLLCRDVSPDGFRFYINLFPELNREDIYQVKDHSRYSTWIRAVLSRSVLLPAVYNFCSSRSRRAILSYEFIPYLQRILLQVMSTSCEVVAKHTLETVVVDKAIDGAVLAISLSFERNELESTGHMKAEDMLVRLVGMTGRSQSAVKYSQIPTLKYF